MHENTLDTRALSARPRRVAAIVAAVAMLLMASVAVVAAVTVSYVQVDASGPPRAIAKGAGDLDDNGTADLVVGSASGGVYWYSNPSWTRRVVDASIDTAEEIEVADLDDDGANDVIVAVPGGAVWFENKDAGRRWTRRTLQSDQSLHDIKAVDVDGDGKLDVVGRGSYPRGGKVYIWRQLSPTSWSTGSVTLPEAGTGLVAVDLDRDRKPDIAVGKYWFKNTSSIGRISFSAAHTYHAAAEQDARIAAGRINADGFVDLFITPPHPTFSGRRTVAWYQAPSDPTKAWTRHVLDRDAPPVIHTAAIVDLDGDGDNDLATAMTSQVANPKIEAFFNNGNGSFGAPFVIAAKASHAMRAVKVRGEQGMFGADYDDRPESSIDLWMVAP